MLWSQVYALKSYIRSSLWIVPFISLLLYVVVIRMVYAIDRETAWQPPGGAWGVLGTQSILETIITLMLTFIVFTFGSLLVAIQVAGGQLTPRIIATTLLRDNAIRFTVGLFTFTLLFATGVLARLETKVPPGIGFIAGLLGFCSIAAFLHLIDYAARLLRPVSIIWRVGEQGRAVIDSVYPKLQEDAGRRYETAPEAFVTRPDRPTSRQVRDFARSEFEGPGRGGTESEWHYRIGAQGGRLRCLG